MMDSNCEFKPQKSIVYNKLLPYYDKINDEAIVQLKEIKENLTKSVIFRDIRPGCIHWIAKLSRYIKLYGFYFSKEDHIHFAKLAYHLAVTPDQEFWVTIKFAQILTVLLKKRELLSPEELELPWKPLSDIYSKVFHSSYKSLGMMMLPQNAELLFKNTIRSCRPYFPPEASSEIFTNWRPQLCPYDISMFRAVSMLELFLPTMFSSKNRQGYEIWLSELIGLWISYHNEPAWGPSMFCAFARLSWQNIGYIDWEPHLPLIFTRILYQFHLPVSYKKMSTTSKRGLEIWSIAMFIVSNLGGKSQTQHHLNRLFKMLESYFHPSNSGYWTRSLNDFQVKLTHYMVQRLHNERYRKASWITTVPKEKVLSEEDITSFVLCIQPCANLSLFSKSGSYEAGLVMHRLALLRPEIVIPPILEQLYSAVDTVTEPHRLIASLQCMVKVARPLVLGGRKSPVVDIRYPEGASHVIPLLFQALPGIDPNDLNKCMVTFQFIATFSALIPIVDCSSAIEEVNDLSEREAELCLQTADFENFVLQFINKTICLIESLALEQSTNTEREKEALNLEENMIEIGLASTFKTILTQSHPKIFDSAVACLLNYTRGRSLEVKVAGKFISAMWRAASKVNAEKTLNLFLPSVCRLILALTENPDIQEEENIDEELLFNLLLLSELIQTKGKALLEHMPSVMQVLSRTVHLKCRKGYRMASSVLRNLLWSLNLTISCEAKSFVVPWNTPFTEYLPIRHWGEAGNIDDLQLKWSEPCDMEEHYVELLVRTFLIPELMVIRGYTEDNTSISRERLHQSLCITQDILLAGGSFPLWDEEPISLIKMSVKREPPPIILHSCHLSVTLDSENFSPNVRKAIAHVTLGLVDHLLTTESDDTKSLNYVTNIYLNLSFFHGVKRDEFEARWKSFERIKQSLSDSVIRKKEHIRALLIERTILQYDMRILESSSPVFTDTHHKIMKSLYMLSTSRYSEVRRKSQGVLSYFFRQFPYSYKLLIPNLIDSLKKDPDVYHEELKGALYIILGSKEKSLAVRRDWETLNLLFPPLIAAQHSEKLSILKLYDSILRTVCRHFELFAIELKVSDSSAKAAYDLLKSVHPAVLDSSVDEQKEAELIIDLEKRSRINLEKYRLLVKELARLLPSGALHWRRQQMCLNFLGILIRPDVTFPEEGVKAMIPFLISDSINLRKVAICYLPCIFKNQKKKHKKVKLDPLSFLENSLEEKNSSTGDNRADNLWMQYDKNSAHLSEEQWNKRFFVHKTWNGWYCWPQYVKVYAPSSEQPKGNRPYEALDDEEKPLFDFFSNEHSLCKLMHFLSLEETKGQDKFDTKKATLFKGLFRNFGDAFVPQITQQLHHLLDNNNESSQRCAAEIMAGMVRGSKHWTFESTHNVLQIACQLLNIIFSKVLNETLADWGSCLTYISMDRDPNRLAPIVELLIEGLIPESEPCFIVSSRLYLSQLFLEQQEWRIAECHHRVLKSLESHLSSPYKNIRDRIGLFLYRIFMRDDSIVNCNKTLSPHHASFVDLVLPQLSSLTQECPGGYSSIEFALRPHFPSASELPDDSIISISLSDDSDEHTLPKGFDSSSNPDSPKEAEDSCSTTVVSLSSSLVYEKKFLEPVKEFETSLEVINPGIDFERASDTAEKKVALRLMNTLCKYLSCMASFTTTSFPVELYRFIPYLCQLESIDSDTEVRTNCLTSLAYLSKIILTPEEAMIPINVLKQIIHSGSWRARISALSYLQVLTFTNMFTILGNSDAHGVVSGVVLDALEDSRAEVRQMASQVLSGLIHSNFIPSGQALLEKFIRRVNQFKGKRNSSSVKSKMTSTELSSKHSGVLGLIAFIGAFPYDVPAFIPEALTILSEHVHDPPPVSSDIKHCLSNFKRTHHDNWSVHKLKFSEDQLSILTDVLISPSYYA